jgi:hypothetical protein
MADLMLILVKSLLVCTVDIKTSSYYSWDQYLKDNMEKKQSLFCMIDFLPGQRLVKDITIQNISSSALQLSSSILDPHGPFMLLNATRTLESMETHSCVVSFSPQSSQEVNP